MSSNVQSPFFGRAWHLAIDTQDGSHLVLTSSQPQALRVTFSVEMAILLAVFQAQVSIYNVSSQSTSLMSSGSPNLYDLWKFNKPLVMGNSVSLSAGYQTFGQPFDYQANEIYRGKVLQPIQTRENVVDYKLTLRLLTGLIEDVVNFTSFPVAKGTSNLNVLNQICANCNPPIQIQNGAIDPAAQQALSQTLAPRGQVIHDRPWRQIRDILNTNNLYGWVGANGLAVRSLGTEPTTTPNWIFAPADPLGAYAPAPQGAKKTLIGTPQQTQDGILFRVLLDNQVRLGDVVQVTGALVQPVSIGYGNLPPFFSPTGMYVVAGIRHVGDSRGQGDDWYTEIHAMIYDFFSAKWKSGTVGQGGV